MLHRYRQRAEGEKPSALLAHTEEVRATLLAALLMEREQEIVDNLVDLLVLLMHRIVARAEDKVETAYVTELKRVANTGTLLFRLADAVLTTPDGTIRDVIFPVVSETTLKDLVTEYKANAPAYRQQVHSVMRSSYRNHYRQMLPQILEILEFRSNNDQHRPVIQALGLLTKYAESSVVLYPPEETVPIEGVVPAKWRDIVVETNEDGEERVNRVSFELSVLQALRDRVRTNLASRESMSRDVLQKRLLLCLFGLGTNIGLKRLVDADAETTYDDLRYVRRQYITKEQLRAAIAHLVNAICHVRHESVWGEGTTTRR